LRHFGLKPSGPAVCFIKRNPTRAPGRVQVPRASGARKLSRCKEDLRQGFGVRRGYGALFAVFQPP